MTTFEPCRHHIEIHDHRGWCIDCELAALRAERKRLMAENNELRLQIPAVRQSQSFRIVPSESTGLR